MLSISFFGNFHPRDVVALCDLVFLAMTYEECTSILEATKNLGTVRGTRVGKDVASH